MAAVELQNNPMKTKELHSSGSLTKMGASAEAIQHQEELEKKGHANWMKIKAVVKMRPFHQRHKTKLCGGFGLLIVVVTTVLILVLGTVAALVVHYGRKPTKKEYAQQKVATNAAVNIGKVGVVPAKEESSDTTRRLAYAYLAEDKSIFHRALDAAMAPTSALAKHGVTRPLRGLAAHGANIDVSKFDAASDYATTPTSTYVEDGLSSFLATPNMIICLLSKTNANDFMNAGPYVAIVDMNQCGENGNPDAKPNFANWTITATSPNATTPSGLIEVTAYFAMPMGGKSNTEFVMKLEVEKSTVTDTGSVQDLYISFYTPDKTAVIASGAIFIDGYISLKVDDATKAGAFSYAMEQISVRDKKEQLLSRSIRTEYVNKPTNQNGWAKLYEVHPDWDDDTGKTVVRTETNCGWNNDVLKVENGQCSDRVNYVPIGNNYRLFDAQGKKVDVMTRVDITYTLPADYTLPAITIRGEDFPEFVIKKGTRLRGSVGKNYAYIYSDWDEATSKHVVPWQQLDHEVDNRGMLQGKTVKENDWSRNDCTDCASYVLGRTGDGSSDSPYRWSLAKTDGTLVVFSEPLDLKMNIPKSVLDVQKTQTKKKYSTLNFTINDGWIDGLPIYCYNYKNQTTTPPTADANYHGGWKCVGDRVHRIDDVIIPNGVTAVHTKKDGTTTNYVLKATSVRQMISTASAGTDCTVAMPPLTAVAAVVTEAKKVVLAAKPTLEEQNALLVKVEAGKTADIYLKVEDTEEFTAPKDSGVQ